MSLGLSLKSRPKFKLIAAINGEKRTAVISVLDERGWLFVNKDQRCRFSELRLNAEVNNYLYFTA